MVYDLLIYLDRYNLIDHHEMHIPVSMLYADRCVLTGLLRGCSGLCVPRHGLVHSKFSHTLLFLLCEEICHLEKEVNTPGEEPSRIHPHLLLDEVSHSHHSQFMDITKSFK